MQPFSATLMRLQKGVRVLINNEGFVLYESAYKQIMQVMNRVGPEAAMQLVNDIAQFGLYGVWPEEDSMSFLYGFEQIATSISSAKDRHAKAKVDGAKGGRPKVELDKVAVMAAYEELGTWGKVAARFNISDRALRDKRKEWEKDLNSEKTENSGKNLDSVEELNRKKPEFSGTSGRNLNINVNVNDNVNAPLVPRSAGASPRTPLSPDGASKIQEKKSRFEF